MVFVPSRSANCNEINFVQFKTTETFSSPHGALIATETRADEDNNVDDVFVPSRSANCNEIGESVQYSINGFSSPHGALIATP